MNSTLILGLDVGGTPRKWLGYQDAIVYHAKGLVAWSLGGEVTTYHGGTRRVDGARSQISTTSIIAVKGDNFNPQKFAKVALTNQTLFNRDRQLCAYCGKHHEKKALSRDHIIPVSRGGLNKWTNVVTACKKCNTKKNDLMLDEANMKLLFVPYEPNHYENLILSNRRILTDQMEYLIGGVPKHSRLLLDLQ